jgi:hypothetical protein
LLGEGSLCLGQTHSKRFGRFSSGNPFGFSLRKQK